VRGLDGGLRRRRRVLDDRQHDERLVDLLERRAEKMLGVLGAQARQRRLVDDRRDRARRRAVGVVRPRERAGRTCRAWTWRAWASKTLLGWSASG
jgi:hypothetical protein